MGIRGLVLSLLLAAAPAVASTPDPPEWTQPIAPFHVIDPALLPQIVADARTAFDAELARQQDAHKGSGK